MVTKRKFTGSPVWCVIFLSLLCGTLSFLPVILKNRGFFTLCTDFNLQQIPFNIALHNVLQENNIGGWIWNYDLGQSIIQGFSFYALGSPFFWLYMLFPANWFPYLVVWIYVLKYAAAAVAAYFYLARFVTDKRYAVIGALLYAFSGFQAVNLMFYHFHDAVAFFPLMLIGIERIREKPSDHGLFVLAVFINCLTNYFFFIQNVVFSVIYFIVRFWEKDRKKMLLKSVRFILCGLWGIAMAAVILVPSLLYLSGYSRVHASFYSPVLWPRYILYVLRGMFYPGEPMSDQSSVFTMEWRSVGCYLPMVGMSLFLAYLGKKGNWLRQILVILLIMTFSPLAGALFTLYTEWYYRWWYMFVMMASLASILVLEHPEQYPVRRGINWSLCLILVLYCILAFVRGPEIYWGGEMVDDGILVFKPLRLLLFASVALAGILLLKALWKYHKATPGLLLVFICVFAVVSNGLTVYFYNSLENPEDVRTDIEIGMQLQTPDSQYRYIGGNNMKNMSGSAAGTSIFSSTVSAGSKEFDALFDYDQSNLTLDKQSIPWLSELIGGKYYVSGSDAGQSAVQKISIGDKTYYVLERSACPIGFRMDHYILRDDLMKHDSSERAAILLKSAVVDTESESMVSGIITKIPEPDAVPADPGQAVQSNQLNAVSDFVRNSHGFRCQTEYDTASLVYFSVPYDKGWTALIDGQKAEIIDSGGMMLLPVPEGKHSVIFHYVTPGFIVSGYISAAAIISFALYMLLRRLVRKRRPAGAAGTR